MDVDLAPELATQALPSLVPENTPPARDRIDEIILHSEAVVQILGVPPHWLVVSVIDVALVL